MGEAILYKYFDRGGSGFANIGLPSGDRLFVSQSQKGVAIFRMILGGRLPIRQLFGAAAVDLPRMCRVFAAATFAPLPRARDMHRDEAQMSAFLDAALIDLKAVGAGRPAPGAVDALDLDSMPEPVLSVFTRAALSAPDEAACVRLFERAKNTAG